MFSTQTLYFVKNRYVFMSLIVEWRGSNNRIGEADILFIYLPGVETGKTCLEALNELNEGIEIARLHHTAYLH